MNKRASFWNNAAQSLPVPYRERYQGYFERAERWELAYDGLIELFARVKPAARHKEVTA